MRELYCKSRDRGRSKKKIQGGVKPENTGEGEGRDQMQNYEENV